MRLLARMIIAISLLAPITGQAAEVWSGCETITAVDNYLAYSVPELILALSPALPGCTATINGAVIFAIGQNGITASNVNYILATSLTAFVAGKKVMVTYDNSTVSCFGQIIAVGGYSAQCP